MGGRISVGRRRCRGMNVSGLFAVFLGIRQNNGLRGGRCFGKSKFSWSEKRPRKGCIRLKVRFIGLVNKSLSTIACDTNQIIKCEKIREDLDWSSSF